VHAERANPPRKPPAFQALNTVGKVSIGHLSFSVLDEGMREGHEAILAVPVLREATPCDAGRTSYLPKWWQKQSS
jgi:hypothetical protein